MSTGRPRPLLLGLRALAGGSLLVALLAGGRARAQSEGDEVDDEGYETTVTAPDPRETVIEDHVGFATTVDTSTARRSVATVGELLEHSSGVSTRSLGGLGDFATVSVRGSAANQVLVLLDGVPLNTGAAAEVDVNLVPAELLDGVDVYRGGAPAWMGAAPLGAAVDLRTRRDRSQTAALGLSYGSFESWRAFGSWSGRLGGDDSDWTGLVGAQYFGSEGDFPYYDDRGTPFNLDDDAERRRLNNASDSGSVLGRLRWSPSTNLRLTLIEVASLDDRGVPGLGQNPSLSTHSSSARSLTQVDLDAPAVGPNVDLRGRVYADIVRLTFTDPNGELGLGEQDARSDGNGFGTAWRVGVFGGDWLQVDAGIEGRFEDFETLDRGPTPDSYAVERVSGAPSVQVTAHLADERLTLTLGGRIDLVRSHLEGEPSVGSPSGDIDRDRFDPLWSVNGGGKLRLWRGAPGELWLQATGGRFARLPTFVEMFGDAGAIIGNPLLVPEEAVGGDVGLRWTAGELPVDATLVGFRYELEELIQFFQNSQLVARPENVAGARLQGLEASLGVTPVGWLALRAAYTWLDATDSSGLAGQQGNRLPARPEHTVAATISGGAAGVRIEYDALFESGHPVDRAGYQLTTDRHLHSARLAWTPEWARGVGLAIDVLNLLDQRSADVPLLPQPPGQGRTTRRPVSDFLGFPLPGRTIFVTLSWQLEGEG